MNRTEGYYWCKLDNKWDIYYYDEIWTDFFKNTHKDHDFEEIDERNISRPTSYSLKIHSANKNPITISSISEAPTTITKNKLIPPHGNTDIIVIEQIENTYKIPVQPQTLSSTNKQTLIDRAIFFLESNSQVYGANTNPMYIWIREIRSVHSSPTLLKQIISNYIKTHTKYTESDIITELETYGTSIGEETKSALCRQMFLDLNDTTFIKALWNHTLLELLKTIDLHTLTVEVNITNYTPCHNIRLISPSGLDIQLRSDDLVYNQGRVFGRKVSFKKSYPLTDHIFQETIKKIL